MTRTVDFYYDYGSPNAYLAHLQLPGILKRTGGTMALKPMLLGGVFQITGNASPAANPLKAPNGMRDMRRYIGKLNIPFKMNPHFPVNTLKMMRGAMVAEEEGYLDRYNEAMYRAMWIAELKMDDDAVLADTLAGAGFDAAHIVKRSQEDAIKARLKSYTELAAARGVFGAPTFFVDDEMFFGQDRLEFVEDALNGKSYLR